jgi:hypothetical protein
MITDKAPGLNSVPFEEDTCMTRIFAGNNIRFTQDTDRPKRNIFKIADRRGD